jgi:hypothetical protein
VSDFHYATACAMLAFSAVARYERWISGICAPNYRANAIAAYPQ